MSKIIPYWKIDAIGKLNTQIENYKNLIKQYELEKEKIKMDKRVMCLSIKDFATLNAKYGNPKDNNFYIYSCERRINILKTEDIKEDDYKNMVIL